MNSSEIQELLALSCEERYDYCLSAIIEEKEIWILINDDDQFLKLFDEEGDVEYLPIWPNSELAQHFANSESELKAHSLTLPQFLKKWVPGLQQDNLEIGVFPGADDTIWITSAKEFEQDIQDELKLGF